MEWLTRTLWANKCEVFQFYVDYRWGFFALLSIILLYFLVYFSLPDPSLLSVVKTIRFWVPFGLLVGAIIASGYFMMAIVAPPQDGQFYVALSQLGCGQDREGDLLLESIKRELSRVQEIARKLHVRKTPIPESIRDETSASLFGQRQGVHFVVYGKLRALGDRENNVEYLGGIAQSWAFHPTIPLGHYSLSKSFNASAPEEVKTFSRDIVVKLLKLYHSSIDGVVNNQFSFTRAISQNGGAFNLGSNLVQRFSIGRDRVDEPYLIGRVLEDGRVVISGHLFDSDGTNRVEIIDNKVNVSTNGSKFDIHYSGDSFFIRDAYDRLLLQVKVEDDIGAFVDTYIQGWRQTDEALAREIEERFAKNAQSPSDHRQDTNRFRSDERWQNERAELLVELQRRMLVVTVTGEIYSAKGIPMVLLESNRLLQYARIPIRAGGFAME